MNRTTPLGQMVMTTLLTAQPGKREELHQTLCSLQEGILGQPGNVDCMVGKDVGHSPRFHLHIVWEDHAAMVSFTAAEPFRVLLGALNVLAVPTEFLVFAADGTFAETYLARAPIPWAYRPSESPSGPP